jgi:hypothetical protein
MPAGRPIAVQKNPSCAPVFEPDSFGRRPGVVFRGSQWLTTVVASPKQGTLAVVFRIDSTGVHTRVVGSVGESAGVRLQTRVGGKMGGEISAGGHIADEAWSPDGYLRDNMVVISILTWPSPFQINVNGKPNDATRPQQANPTGGKGLVLGAYSDKGGIAFHGAVGEVMLFDRVLSTQEMASLHGSLTSKWGVR